MNPSVISWTNVIVYYAIFIVKENGVKFSEAILFCLNNSFGTFWQREPIVI